MPRGRVGVHLQRGITHVEYVKPHDGLVLGALWWGCAEQLSCLDSEAVIHLDYPDVSFYDPYDPYDRFDAYDPYCPVDPYDPYDPDGPCFGFGVLDECYETKCEIVGQF